MAISPLWGNIFKKNKLKIRDFLERVPVFENLNKSELYKLERYVFVRKFTCNEYLFRQNEPGAGMYVIIEGQVGIQLELGNNEVKELVSLNKGDFFGEMSLLSESPRSAAAVALSTEVQVISFFRGDLLKVIEEYPSIACKILWNIGTVLSERLRKSNEILNEYQNKAT